MKKILLLSFFTLLIACSEKPKGDISFENGAVVQFDWKKLVPGFSKGENHIYGFDKDPRGVKNPDYSKNVYVSTKHGESATIILNLPNKVHKKYSLKNIVSGETFGPWNAVDSEKVELFAGTYLLYGDDTPLNRYVTVVEYSKKIVPIVYVQFDGEYSFCEDESCYSFEKTVEYFDKVFSQAITFGNFTQKRPEEFYLSSTLSFDLTDKITDTHKVRALKDRAENLSGNAQTVIFAINAVQWTWTLQATDLSNIFQLNNYFHTRQHENYDSISVHLNSCDSSSQKTETKLKLISYNPSTMEAAVFIKDAEKFPSCATLTMESAEPMMPTPIKNINGQISYTAQINYSSTTADSYVISKSFIMAPRVWGKSSQYTIQHELGHSLGLLDIHRNLDDETFKITDLGEKRLVNATTETNLMTYAIPTGPMLRYRDVQAVCSGTNYKMTNAYDKAKLITDNQWDCINLGNCHWPEYFQIDVQCLAN